MFERFTHRGRKVMALANQEAKRYRHECIGPEHILLGLIKEGSGVGANIMSIFGVDLRKVRDELAELVQEGTKPVDIAKLPHTPLAKKVIENAIEEAKALQNYHGDEEARYVGSEHLLLGLVREEKGLAAVVLTRLGLKLEAVREETLRLLHSSQGIA